MIHVLFCHSHYTDSLPSHSLKHVKILFFSFFVYRGMEPLMTGVLEYILSFLENEAGVPNLGGLFQFFP